MIETSFRVMAYLTLAYTVALQLYMLGLTVVSGAVLFRQRLFERFGRIEDMLASDATPPVSIVIPAYNESVGIVESIRSMTMVSYPRFEIVVCNDGSKDNTLEKLIDAFKMVAIPLPFRENIPTAKVRKVYRSTLPIRLTVVDKENGGRADALNAGINVSRYPYVMLTDADVIIQADALVHAMRHVAEDRFRTVGVGGNIRPLNGCTVKHGHIVEAALPKGLIARYQVLEYIRSFIASRPAWSAYRALPNLSGAFGIFRRDVVTEVGGLTEGHMGEDMDLTMRIHRHMRQKKEPYRLVYSPSAIVWTEVPATRKVLRTQRIRWHRGLLTTIKDFRGMMFNPKYGTIGLIGWPAMFFFEFLAPIVEFIGWFVVPIALGFGFISWEPVLLLFLLTVLAGAITSLLALFLDERYGYFNEPTETLRLLVLVFVENLGLRQQTVWWRIRALLGGESTKVWGDMQRQGVSSLGKAS